MGSVGEYYFSKKLREIDQMRAQGQSIISLGVGGPDQPPHPRVIARLAEEAAKPNTHSYQPYKGTAILREAFARCAAGTAGGTAGRRSRLGLFLRRGWGSPAGGERRCGGGMWGRTAGAPAGHSPVPANVPPAPAGHSQNPPLTGLICCLRSRFCSLSGAPLMPRPGQKFMQA